MGIKEKIKARLPQSRQFDKVDFETQEESKAEVISEEQVGEQKVGEQKVGEQETKDRKVIVVKELPVQVVREGVDNDGNPVELITVEEALTRLFE